MTLTYNQTVEKKQKKYIHSFIQYQIIIFIFFLGIFLILICETTRQSPLLPSLNLITTVVTRPYFIGRRKT